MEELINDRLDNLFRSLDNLYEIREMKTLKEKIYKDQKLKELLDKYHSMDQYDPSFIDIKSQIINNPDIKRYHELENELYFSILDANKKFSALKESKGCYHESN